MAEKKIIACIDQMTLEQARRELAWGTFGEPASTTHSYALQWLSIKEAEERDKRESETHLIAKEANRIALLSFRSRWKDRIITIIAIIIAMIAARDDIKWLISWLIDKFKTS